MSEVADNSTKGRNKASHQASLKPDPSSATNRFYEYWFEIGLGFAGFFVVLLGIGGVLLGAHLGPAQGRALIGDFVGGTTTPILTSLTFIGVLVGIALQRRELIATRKELERSAEALEKQSAHLERQRLSQAFFELFEMYKSVVSDISYTSFGRNSITTKGKAALDLYAEGISRAGNISREGWNLNKLKDAHQSYNDHLGNYFRVIFRLLSFLSSNQEDGDFFSDIFRAQLTTGELYLLFFNCVSDVGKPMQEYAASCELFDNMPLPPEASFAVVASEIDPRCFGGNEDLLRLVVEDVN